MLSLPPSVMISVCAEPVDMRKQFDGLAAIVGSQLAEDPLSGHLYVFFNRDANRIKVLWWGAPGETWSWRRETMDP
jgi:transposase